MSYYYLTPRYKALHLFFLLFINWLFIGFPIYLTHRLPIVRLLLFAIGIINSIYVFLRIRNMHIVVTKDGIQFHSLGIAFETKWSDIESVSRFRLDGFLHESLVVDNSRTLVKKWSLFSGRNMPTSLLAPSKTFIPLSCFAENWRDSEFGQQIKQYAPHLFEKEKSVTRIF